MRQKFPPRESEIHRKKHSYSRNMFIVLQYFYYLILMFFTTYCYKMEVIYF